MRENTQIYDVCARMRMAHAVDHTNMSVPQQAACGRISSAPDRMMQTEAVTCCDGNEAPYLLAVQA